MAKVSRFLKLIKINKFYSHFAVEFMIFLILIFMVGVNLGIQTNSKDTKTANKSLFFNYLKNHSDFNPKLVDAYESVNLRLSQNHSMIKQVLAAQTVYKEDGTTNIPDTMLPTMAGSTLLKPNPAESTSMPKRDIQEYVVKSGDTLSTIAARYNVSVATVAWANNLSENSTIKPGAELEILPTNGVKHTVKEGDTISAIAKKYGLTDEEGIEGILAANDLEGEDLIMPGDELVIPGGAIKPPPAPSPSKPKSLARPTPNRYQVPDDYAGGAGNLLWPVPATHRISQYASRRHMALDIPCRGDCLAVASADGIVELAGWQAGYGNTIIINIGGGRRIRYAHAEKLLVSAGESVVAGQPVIIVGNTGRSTGPHLHYEVKVGGILKNPLPFVQ